MDIIRADPVPLISTFFDATHNVIGDLPSGQNAIRIPADRLFRKQYCSGRKQYAHQLGSGQVYGPQGTWMRGQTVKYVPIKQISGSAGVMNQLSSQNAYEFKAANLARLGYVDPQLPRGGSVIRVVGEERDEDQQAFDDRAFNNNNTDISGEKKLRHDDVVGAKPEQFDNRPAEMNDEPPSPPYQDAIDDIERENSLTALRKILGETGFATPPSTPTQGYATPRYAAADERMAKYGDELGNNSDINSYLDDQAIRADQTIRADLSNLAATNHDPSYGMSSLKIPNHDPAEYKALENLIKDLTNFPAEEKQVGEFLQAAAKVDAATSPKEAAIEALEIFKNLYPDIPRGRASSFSTTTSTDTATDTSTDTSPGTNTGTNAPDTFSRHLQNFAYLNLGIDKRKNDSSSGGYRKKIRIDTTAAALAEKATDMPGDDEYIEIVMMANLGHVVAVAEAPPNAGPIPRRLSLDLARGIEFISAKNVIDIYNLPSRLNDDRKMARTYLLNIWRQEQGLLPLPDNWEGGRNKSKPKSKANKPGPPQAWPLPPRRPSK